MSCKLRKILEKKIDRDSTGIVLSFLAYKESPRQYITRTSLLVQEMTLFSFHMKISKYKKNRSEIKLCEQNNKPYVLIRDYSTDGKECIMWKSTSLEPFRSFLNEESDGISSGQTILMCIGDNFAHETNALEYKDDVENCKALTKIVRKGNKRPVFCVMNSWLNFFCKLFFTCSLSYWLIKKFI